MAFVQSFSIEGLAGRDQVVTHELDPHVNVFWGVNGGGKTSLLRLLDSAMSDDGNLIRRVPFERATVTLRDDAARYTLKRSISAAEIAAVPESEEDDFDPEAQGSQRERIHWATRLYLDEPLSDDHRANDLAIVRNRFLPISRIARRARPSQYWRYGIAEPDLQEGNAFASHIRTVWRDYTSKTNLQVRSIQQAGLASILAILFGGATEESTDVAEPLAASGAFDLVRTFLAEQSLTLRTGESEFKRRYELDEALVGVVANIQRVSGRVQESQKPQQEFQAIIDELYSGGKHIVATRRSAAVARPDLQVEWGDKSIPLQGLSSGEKQMLQLLLEVLAADTVPVMVDEPELSLHVDWQRRLVPSMRRLNPDCQLLLATHSPEVMASVEDNLVFEL